MLVLSRKIQEQILFPSLNIRITVLSVGTNRVQLGIEAPSDIDITRPEAGKKADASRPPTESTNGSASISAANRRVFEMLSVKTVKPHSSMASKAISSI